MADTVADLMARLKVAREQEEADRIAAAKATHPEYEFTLVPDADDDWHPVFDPECSTWLLTGKVTNEDALKAVGRSAQNGAMRYVYNGATGRFVCSVSGGRIFTKDPEVFARLSAFVAEHPEGGDVTALMGRQA